MLRYILRILVCLPIGMTLILHVKAVQYTLDKSQCEVL